MPKYLLTLTGSLDDMPIGLFDTPQDALAVAVGACYLPCESVPKRSPEAMPHATERNRIIGSTIIWGMGPSEPMGYKISKFNDAGLLVNVAIFTYDDAPECDETDPVQFAKLREWCQENWQIEKGF